MKMRIDEIKNLSDLCTGCMACVDACPKQCIQPVTRPDGFRYAEISDVDCVYCGKCFAVCPIETHSKNTGERHLYAAYAQNDKTRNNGSSGGVFEFYAKVKRLSILREKSPELSGGKCDAVIVYGGVSFIQYNFFFK